MNPGNTVVERKSIARWSVLTLALATMLVLLPAPPASSAPHETVGGGHVDIGGAALLAECHWDVLYSTEDPDTEGASDEGLDDTRSRNWFQLSVIFDYEDLFCEGTSEEAYADGLHGTWGTYATGYTDGAYHRGIGENCSEGGSERIDGPDSDSTVDEVHSIPLEIRHSGFVVMQSDMHFTRLGSVVLADGPLYDDPTDLPSPRPAPDYWFQAELTMTPDGHYGADCYNYPVDEWRWIGTVEIYDAAGAMHYCGQEDDQVKTGDPNCDDETDTAGWFSNFIGSLTDGIPGAGDLIDFPDSGFKESEQCEAAGGSDSRVIDSTAQGVRTFVYVYQPAVDEVWVCARVEEAATGEGYGGRLEATPTDASPQVTGGPSSPSTDSDSTACTTTTPNDVPGSHPIAYGGVGSVDYMVDAYVDDSEAWVCLQVGSSDYRVVVPLSSGTPDVQFGTVASWHPDEGTPGS